MNFSLICRRPVDRSKAALKEILELPGVKKSTEKFEPK